MSIESKKDSYKRYYEKNKEKRKLSSKNYAIENSDKIKEYSEKYRKENNEKIKEYYKVHKDEISEKLKKYREENKEKLLKQKKEYYLINKDKIKEHREKNKEKRKEYLQRNRDRDKIRDCEYVKEKRSIDVLYRLKGNIRASILTTLKRKKIGKINSTEKIIGCTFVDLKNYIEKQFENWMSWDNYGKYDGEYNHGWDIDHIIELKTAKTEEDLIKLNHFSNLRPLDSRINRVDRNK